MTKIAITYALNCRLFRAAEVNNGRQKRRGHDFHHALFFLAHTLPQVLAEKIDLLTVTG
jgi:hypothetical protein